MMIDRATKLKSDVSILKMLIIPPSSSVDETTSDSEYHPITSLRYRLYCEPVDLSPLVVRQVRRFEWRSAQVSVFILGASHAVSLLLPSGRMITELLTCLPPVSGRQAGKSWDHEWQVPNQPGEEWNKDFQAGGVCGRARVYHIALTPSADFVFDSFSNGNKLHEPFPLPTGETAWTRVAWREDGNSLVVETIHTYPEDSAAIRSATTFSVSLPR